MNNKEFEKKSEEIHKELLKSPNWKSYEIGLEGGRREGALEELDKLILRYDYTNEDGDNIIRWIDLINDLKDRKKELEGKK